MSAVAPVLECPDPGLRRVVIGDLHSDLAGLRALLEELGVIDGAGVRRPGFWVVQLGDLLHLGHSEHAADLRALEAVLAGGWVDVQLVGNHEASFTHGIEAGRFAGMHSHLGGALQGALDRSRAQWTWQMATTVDGWLVTHAGVHGSLSDQLEDDPVKAAGALCKRLERRAAGGSEDPLIDWVGPGRGGSSPVGGALWCDFHELAVNPGDRLQVAGHTPLPCPELISSPGGARIWVADVGAALSRLVCALVKDAGDDAWEPVIVSSPPPWRA